MFFTGWCWGSVSNHHSSKAPYIGLWVFVWAAHGHMHTWRSKTSQQSRFPPLVSAHKASPWQLRQNLSTWKQSFFFFSCFNFFFTRFFAFTEICFPTIIISNDNNLYSINYLYCTIISPRINLYRGAFLKVKLSTVSFCFVLCSIEPLQSTQMLTDSKPVSFFLSCTEIKLDILEKKIQTKAKLMHNWR